MWITFSPVIQNKDYWGRVMEGEWVFGLGPGKQYWGLLKPIIPSPQETFPGDSGGRNSWT